ncbi:MAG: GNAT family N-acetyltransferase [Candidatus Kapabacteria bacterium]|nr:GNAT family N-acetyltransferase [Candidatus Kapabacteria bacterium]
MNPSITIRKPEEQEWQQLRELRLDALKHEPQSFGSSYEKEVAKESEFWITLAKNSHLKDSSVCAMVAVLNNKFIGMIGCYLPEQGNWNIWGMYVLQEFRGNGVARSLMECAIRLIRQRNPDSVIQLYVNVEQTPAVSLYKAMGFEISELLPNQLMGDGQHYDEYIMLLQPIKTNNTNQ